MGDRSVKALLKLTATGRGGFFAALAVATAVVLSACSQSDDGPKAAIEKFVNAINDRDAAAVLRVHASQCAKGIDIKAFGDTFSAGFAPLGDVKIEIRSLDVTETGDSAVAHVSGVLQGGPLDGHDFTELTGGTSSIPLAKEGDVWHITDCSFVNSAVAVIGSPTASPGGNVTASQTPTGAPEPSPTVPTQGTPLPDGYPGDIVPILPGGVVIDAVDQVEGDGNFTVVFITAATSQDIVLLYRDALKKQGFAVDEGDPSSEMPGLLATGTVGGHDSTVLMTVSPSADYAGRTEVSLFITMPTQ